MLGPFGYLFLRDPANSHQLSAVGYQPEWFFLFFTSLFCFLPAFPANSCQLSAVGYQPE